MCPQIPVLIPGYVFIFEVLHVRKGQPRETAKHKHVPYPLQPLVRYRLMDQDFQFGFSQVVFGLVVFFLEFVVLERVLLDLLVPDRVDEVFETAEQVHGSVVLAVMPGLHKDVQADQVGVVHGCQGNIVLLILFCGIFPHVS